MRQKKAIKESGRANRHGRIRKKLRGTVERPRLVVFRSRKHIYAQIINDESGKTLLAASTLEKEFPAKDKAGTQDGAREIGKMLAVRAMAQSIKQVAFDRAGYNYHGRVKALADAAREGGLEF